MGFILKPFLLAYRQLSSCCVLTWPLCVCVQVKGEGAAGSLVSLLIRALMTSWGPHPHDPHLTLIISQRPNSKYHCVRDLEFRRDTKESITNSINAFIFHKTHVPAVSWVIRAMLETHWEDQRFTSISCDFQKISLLPDPSLLLPSQTHTKANSGCIQLDIQRPRTLNPKELKPGWDEVTFPEAEVQVSWRKVWAGRALASFYLC